MATPPPDTVSHVPNDPVVTTTRGMPSIAGYQVQELVGRGGMGKVYRAKHLALGRTIALKVMTHEQDERLTARFRDEARAVAKLQHPNIAQLFDTGTSDGRPYYSMEFADGGTLASQWDGKPQDPAATAAAMECVARAIQHSHEHGILHRDLKPGNVLLAADGTPKVADFGLAKELPSAVAGHATLPAAAGLTRTGEVVGTPAYMPPEQASGVTSALTPAADVYSLGAMLYEGLTGRPPFQAPDALQTLFLVLASDPVPPKTLQPKLPADLNTICLKCLEKQPKKRYPTAGELADDLRRFLNGEPIVARPVGRMERAVKWARRHKAGAALVAVSAVLFVALAAFGVVEVVNAIQLREANDQLANKNGELEETNRRLTEAKAESDKSYGLATSTLDEVVRDLGTPLNGVPQTEGLMLDVYGRSSGLYRRLADLRPEDRTAAERYVTALSTQSVFETGYGRLEAATKTRAEQEAFLRRELAKTPDDPLLRWLELCMVYDAATAAQEERAAERAADARKRYADLTRRYAEQFPGRVETGKAVVKGHWLRSFDASATRNLDGQVSAFRDAAAEARRMTEPTARFTFLTGSLTQLGDTLQTANKPAEADAAYAEAEAVFAAAPREQANTKYGLALMKVKRASVAYTAGRFQDAYDRYTTAEPVLRELVDEFALHASYRFALAECLLWRGKLLQHKKPDECRRLLDDAVGTLDKLVELQPKSAICRSQRDHYAEMRKALFEQMEKK